MKAVVPAGGVLRSRRFFTQSRPTCTAASHSLFPDHPGAVCPGLLTFGCLACLPVGLALAASPISTRTSIRPACHAVRAVVRPHGRVPAGPARRAQATSCPRHQRALHRPHRYRMAVSVPERSPCAQGFNRPRRVLRAGRPGRESRTQAIGAAGPTRRHQPIIGQVCIANPRARDVAAYTAFVTPSPA